MKGSFVVKQCDVCHRFFKSLPEFELVTNFSVGDKHLKSALVYESTGNFFKISTKKGIHTHFLKNAKFHLKIYHEPEQILC